MRKIYLILFCVASTLCCNAQNEKEVAIGEILVSGKRVVTKNGEQWIYPSKEEINSSTNGYTLIDKLGLKNIKTDIVNHSISALDNSGNVVVNINGIRATKQDMMSINPKTIKRIEYSDSPSLRYDENTVCIH